MPKIRIKNISAEYDLAKKLFLGNEVEQEESFSNVSMLSTMNKGLSLKNPPSILSSP